ncbi:Insect odorant-binding protein A10/Ejaculatory bulb-specific protein 3 [Cinara cedri]|uniref:Insect odorant-binding protein A10/Ejaculatory bulb-specific protein 3 n=1 Tax=Cinara cedri TaxID=506608 RepID=A0A5E4MU88_9HEMI|nr:Insect odorant-binding protein A10/Ejaculatory bulb-specific protein 3 [Cinara cedri]
MTSNYIKIAFALCFLVSVCLAKPAASGDEEIKDLPTYLKKFEKLDLEKALANERVLDNYLKCFLNEGPCTQEARDLKKVFPALAKTLCKGCEEKQLTSIKKAFKYVKAKRPEQWDRLVKIYDPTNANLNKFLGSS